MSDPYARIDRDKDRDDSQFDAKADYLEESAIDIMAGFKKELRETGRIDHFDLDDVEITQKGIDENTSYDKALFDLAYKRAEEKLAEAVSWN